MTADRNQNCWAGDIFPYLETIQQSTSSSKLRKPRHEKIRRNKFETLTEALAVNIKAFQSDNQFTFLISMKFSHKQTALSLVLRKADN